MSGPEIGVALVGAITAASGICWLLVVAAARHRRPPPRAGADNDPAAGPR